MIHVLPDPAALTVAALRVVTTVLRGRARLARGPVRAVLSGGSTPRDLYRMLAAEDALPWQRLELFWGDERRVPATDPRSNYGMTRDTGLLDRPLGAVHPLPGDLPVAEAAARYEELLRTTLPAREPHFDLVILGLGADGHTASLFPGSAGPVDGGRWVVATGPYQGTERLSLTLPLLSSGRVLLFLAAGEEKAAAVRDTLRPSSAADATPAHLLLDLVTTGAGARRERGCLEGLGQGAWARRAKVVWLLDRPAASLLPARRR